MDCFLETLPRTNWLRTGNTEALMDGLLNSPLKVGPGTAVLAANICLLVGAQHFYSGVLYRREPMTDWSGSEASIGGGHGFGTVEVGGCFPFDLLAHSTRRMCGVWLRGRWCSMIQ